MKKIIIPILSTLIIVTCTIVNNSKVINNNVEIKEDKTNNNLLSIMLETEDSSGKYQTSTLSTWPADGYKYNSQLSYCENGGTLFWDEESNALSFNGNKSEKCYIYFDIYNPTLTEYVINKYTGTQGENNIYYHASTLTNGAADNSYRYAGSNPNNYVCFGSEESSCPEDNLYRVIGVFGDNNHGLSGQKLVKLIKVNSYINSYWNSKSSNDWQSSKLRTTLNENYLSTFSSEYQNMIANVNWKIDGKKSYSSSLSFIDFYKEEINNNINNDMKKIGLMYVTDFLYAFPSNYWEKVINDYEANNIKNENWLYFGNYEWTISKISDKTNMVFTISNQGYIDEINGYVTDKYESRPSFYLNQSVQYIKGSGTISDPIYVK